MTTYERDDDAAIVQRHLSDVQQPLWLDHSPVANDEWKLLTKPGLGGRQRWRWSPQGDMTAYLKRYTRTGWREQWDRAMLQTLRHSRAWWEYAQCRALADANIRAPRGLACSERMTLAVEQRSAVLLGAVEGDAFDRVWAALPPSSPWRRLRARIELTRRLARFVSAFHSTGNCHRDLYLCHLFVELCPTAANTPVFTVIDLARTFRPRLRRMRWILKDLSQLDASAQRIGISRTDRWRFLLAYLGLERQAPRARWFARRIATRSSRILRRDARKGRG